MTTLETYRGVYLWNYIPSLPAAITFAVLFGLATAAHGWRMIVTKSWFSLPFVVGGLPRAAAHGFTGSLVPYIVQDICLVISPVFFAATLYMVYARIVTAAMGETYSPIPPRRTTIIFVFGDLSCLNIQAGSAGLLPHPRIANIGDYIIVVGLILQVLMFIGFMACCLLFNKRFCKHMAETGNTRDIPWQSCLNMLYGTSLTVLARNIYRVIEFLMGQDGYLLENEWPLYVFDGALMFLVMLGFFIWHASSLLRPEFRDSLVELTGRQSDVAGDSCTDMRCLESMDT
ncbi:hypothetical protein UA08_07105 [Talaromyces atroroseus]|uniref:Protein RTA1 n=1 Tax=Talaromyces atroroseus TaxID=1441469 RepID=A0A225AQ69_TALAT|nr:hypothetical protein UA08_07105 [Talaromyces atroroseus]OKL57749.1 hypothetical protein UA08_07105 [Talaromyces atroroseus]